MRLDLDQDETMEAEWERAFAHESGHALMAVLQGIPCHGICFEKDSGKFCTLTNARNRFLCPLVPDT
jgi:hypothetical protein